MCCVTVRQHTSIAILPAESQLKCRYMTMLLAAEKHLSFA